VIARSLAIRLNIELVRAGSSPARVSPFRVLGGRHGTRAGSGTAEAVVANAPIGYPR
jgi:hypothetical protein